jgi:hypothetical protein
MNQIEKKLPQWNAPETLLARVIDEIEKKSCCVGFFSWAAVYRFTFCITTMVVAGMVCVIAYGVGSGWDVLLFVNTITTQVSIWYDCLVMMHSIFYDLIIRFLQQPAVLLFVFVFAVIIIVTWTGSVAALYQMLSTHHRRKYI